MTPRSLTYIIVLMSVSLLGICSLQWHWVQQGLESKNQEFEQSVRRAMATAMTELAERETERMLANELEVQDIPSVKVLLKEQQDFLSSSEEDESSKVVTETTTRSRSVATTIEWESEEVEIGNLDSILQEHVHLDSTAISPSVIVKRTVVDNGELVLDTFLEKDALSYRSQVFGEAMKSIFVKGLSIEESIESRLEDVQMDSLLLAHLANEGVDLPFAYAVEDAEGKYAQASASLTSMPEGAFERPVFAYGKNPAKLLMHFPNRSMFVVRSMGWVLVLAIVFSLIMLATFAVTLFYILRQKRISTIKSDFISNMTHEFKTPLATIGLAVDSMRHPAVKSNDEQIEHFAGLIKTEKKRLNSHIEKILQLAKMERGELQLKPEQLNLQELAEEAAASMRLQASSKGGHIVLEGSDEVVSVKGDRLHLFNAIINLLDNAIKYCERAPDIVLSLKQHQGQTYLQVADNGIGMKPEEQKRIFDTFYRVQRGDVHNVKGFGLGLSYVREIVGLHQGEMLLESEKGKGSIIGFKLPAYV